MIPYAALRAWLHACHALGCGQSGTKPCMRALLNSSLQGARRKLRQSERQALSHTDNRCQYMYSDGGAQSGEQPVLNKAWRGATCEAWVVAQQQPWTCKSLSGAEERQHARKSLKGSLAACSTLSACVRRCQQFKLLLIVVSGDQAVRCSSGGYIEPEMCTLPRASVQSWHLQCATDPCVLAWHWFAP